MKIKSIINNQRARSVFVLIVGSVLSTLLLFLSLTGLATALTMSEGLIYFLFGALLVGGLYHLVYALTNRHTKVLYITHFILCAYCIALSSLAFIIPQHPVVLTAICALYAGGIIINRAFLIYAKRKHVHSILVNSLIILAMSIMLLAFIASSGGDELGTTLAYILIFILFAIIGFKNLIVCVFSRIKRSVLKEILVKTYALEIILGLVVLILAFSLVFLMTEESMATYGDALWYSFTVVTTIGFGDPTCNTVIGRLLSVVLGIYGIIVVALITSIIVNFYNESSAKHAQEKELEEKKEKESSTENDSENSKE